MAADPAVSRPHTERPQAAELIASRSFVTRARTSGHSLPRRVLEHLRDQLILHARVGQVAEIIDQVVPGIVRARQAGNERDDRADLRLAAQQEPAADGEDADDRRAGRAGSSERSCRTCGDRSACSADRRRRRGSDRSSRAAPPSPFAVSTMSTASARTVRIRSAVRRLIASCRTGMKKTCGMNSASATSAIHGCMKSM